MLSISEPHTFGTGAKDPAEAWSLSWLEGVVQIPLVNIHIVAGARPCHELVRTSTCPEFLQQEANAQIWQTPPQLGAQLNHGPRCH